MNVHEQSLSKNQYIGLFTQLQLLLRQTQLAMAGTGEGKAKRTLDMTTETKHYFMFQQLLLNYQMSSLRVGGHGLCEVWSPLAGTATCRYTPETFYTGSEVSSEDVFSSLYCWTSLKEEEWLPIHHGTGREQEWNDLNGSGGKIYWWFSFPYIHQLFE